MIESFGQRAFSLKSDMASTAVTELGGHLAPVEFRAGKRTLRPLSIAPWWNEPTKGPPIIQVLRGDFFCLPFGGNSAPWKNEKHEVHGETANRRWKLVEADESPVRSRLHLRLKTRVRTATVDKIVELRPGHPAIYQRHIISGLSGRMSLGHHAMLKFESEGLIATSPFRFGQVYPGEFEQPARGGYSILKSGAQFSSLGKVPMRDGKTADLSRYPAREGFEDLVMISSEPDLDFAWTAVSFPHERFLWIAFKKPRVLASTIFWHSNGGRHYAPWNGRHRGVLGLEEVTAHFHDGIRKSVERNSLKQRGIPTCLIFSKTKPTIVNYIMAAAEIPHGFGFVKSVRNLGGARVEISDAARRKINLNLDLEFLHADN